MQLEVNVPEVFNIFKEIGAAPEKLFEMMRLDLQERAGDTLTALMEWELTLHQGRKPYERRASASNHRNGSYPRRFTMKGIGEVEIKVPRNRQGTFKTAVLPKGWQYENTIAQDLSMLLLAGLSSRSLAMISRRLLGRKLSHDILDGHMSGQLQDAACQGMGIAAALRGETDPDLTQRPARQTQKPLERQMDPHRLEADGYRAKLSPDHPFAPDFIRTTCRATQQGETVLLEPEMDRPIMISGGNLLVSLDAKTMVK